MKFGMDVHHLCQMSLTVNFWEVKVKVVGHNHHTEYISLAVAPLWFKKSAPNLQTDVSTFDKIQNGGLAEVFAFLLVIVTH